MDAYLFDTTALSVYLDPKHPDHDEKARSLDTLPLIAPCYISTAALAELKFGIELSIAIGKGNLPTLNEILNKARTYNVLEITHHTAMSYAELKAKMASKYLAKPLRRDKKPKYLEDWVDQANGKALGVDENDLWMCAQAKERDLIFVTADKGIRRIEDADSDVRLLII